MSFSMSNARRAVVSDRLDRINDFATPVSQRLLRRPVQTLRCSLFARLSPFLSRKGLDFPVNARAIYGGRIRVPTGACWDIVAAGTYLDQPERRLIRFMLSHLHKGGCMVDAGANIGFFSLLAAHLVGERGYVAAFEPSLTPLTYLRENAANLPQLHVIEQALSDEDGEITLFEGAGNAMVSSTTVHEHLAHRAAEDDVTSRNVPTTTIDSFIAQKGRVPDLLKIDVEGAELSVLKGAAGTLRDHKPAVVLEVGFADHDDTEYQSMEFLTRMGYRHHAIDKGGLLREIKPKELEAHGARVNADASSYHNLDNLVFLHASKCN